LTKSAQYEPQFAAEQFHARAHGSEQLNPIASIEMIALCSKLLNGMYQPASAD
jgi:hypothetical protein